MFIVIAAIFAVSVLLFALLPVFWTRRFSLQIFVCASAGALLSVAFLDFLPRSFAHPDPHLMGAALLTGLLAQAVFDLYGVKQLKFLDRLLLSPAASGQGAVSDSYNKDSSKESVPPVRPAPVAAALAEARPVATEGSPPDKGDKGGKGGSPPDKGGKGGSPPDKGGKGGLKAAAETGKPHSTKTCEAPVCASQAHDSHVHVHAHAHALSPAGVCSLVGCLTVCSFFDGIRLFSSLLLDRSAAAATAFSLFFHLASEGLIVAVLGADAGIKKKAVFVLAFFMAGAFLAGAALSGGLLSHFSEEGLIAFSSGTLIYICFVHLLPVSLKSPNQKWFIAGLALASLPHLFH